MNEIPNQEYEYDEAYESNIGHIREFNHIQITENNIAHIIPLAGENLAVARVMINNNTIDVAQEYLTEDFKGLKFDTETEEILFSKIKYVRVLHNQIIIESLQKNDEYSLYKAFINAGHYDVLLTFLEADDSKVNPVYIQMLIDRVLSLITVVNDRQCDVLLSYIERIKKLR